MRRRFSIGRSSSGGHEAHYLAMFLGRNWTEFAGSRDQNAREQLPRRQWSPEPPAPTPAGELFDRWERSRRCARKTLCAAPLRAQADALPLVLTHAGRRRSRPAPRRARGPSPPRASVSAAIQVSVPPSAHSAVLVRSLCVLARRPVRAGAGAALCEARAGAPAGAAGGARHDPLPARRARAAHPRAPPGDAARAAGCAGGRRG